MTGEEDEGEETMTPEEALSAAWGEYRARTQFFSVAEQSAFCDGFRAGLAHARRWRPLTSDEATWPEEGQWLVLWDNSSRRVGYRRDFHRGSELLARGWTHWLPLPPPSEEDGR